jgi:hypothetical protein
MSRKLRQSLLIVALTCAFGAAALLAFRAVELGRIHSAEETIRPWMSVPYIAHSHRVSPGVLWTALGIPPHPHDRRPLSRIAREQKRPVEEVIVKLKNALEHAAKSHPPPVQPPPRAEP